MSFRLTILGCGSSGGVPRVGNDWGQCDPSNPRNRRRRCAAFIERSGPLGTTSVLIDTGPDLREQLLSIRAARIDAVLMTHDHADHTHGLDDLRNISYMMKRRVPVWMDARTRATLTERFAYCFEKPAGSSYPPILTAHEITPAVAVRIDGPGGEIVALPVLQEHADIPSLGFRVGNVAYSPDISGLPESSVALLQGLDVWIVDALRHQPHPSHFTVKQALAWIERIAPRRAILTHLHVDLDYAALARELPANVVPAYDGLQITW